jgi:NitT/TauT family transport system substrate-binding protein
VSAQTLTPLRVASSPSEDVVALLWGLEGGAFRAAGLDVQLQKANSGAAVAAAVAGGAVDIGKSSLLSLLIAHGNGIPFVLIAPSGIYDANLPTVEMMVARDSPIASGKDCNNKTVAVSALNDLFSLGTQAWVDRNGGDSRTLRFIEVPGSAMGSALSSGRVDIATVTDPVLGELLASGVARKLAPPHDAIARLFMLAAFFARIDYVAANKATVASFRRVVEETSRYANDHHEQMMGLLATYMGIDRSVLLAEPRQPLATTMDVRLIQPLIDVSATYKAIPARFDARTIIDSGAN